VTYTALALAAMVAALLIEFLVLKTGLLRQLRFYLAYGIVVFFQLITNGYLTGREIVLYDPGVIIGIRIVYAPIEDLLFGFSLVFMTMAVWIKIGMTDRAKNSTGKE
jgi:lycopene cyclase domain-containing protein